MTVWRVIESILVAGAKAAWPVFKSVNQYAAARPFQPQWSASPLPRTQERSKPPLDFPRTTDSLCPSCVQEVRQRILNGDQPIASLPVQILTYATSPYADWQQQAWTGALVLVVMILVLNVLARLGMRSRIGAGR